MGASLVPGFKGKETEARSVEEQSPLLPLLSSLLSFLPHLQWRRTLPVPSPTATEPTLALPCGPVIPLPAGNWGHTELTDGDRDESHT